MKITKLEIFKLEDRILFEAAAVADIITATESTENIDVNSDADTQDAQVESNSQETNINTISKSMISLLASTSDTILVTNTDDSGTGSLRDALDLAANSTSDNIIINFADDLFVNGESTIEVDDDIVLENTLSGKFLTIDGGDDRTVILNSSGDNAIFSADNRNSDWNLTLENLELNGGNSYDFASAVYLHGDEINFSMNSVDVLGGSSDGGAVHLESWSNLTINIYDSTFANNSSYSYGGGLYAASLQDLLTANIANSTFFQNSSSSDGGAIYLSGENTDIDLADVSIVNNETDVYGGGIYVRGDGDLSVDIVNSIILGNSAKSDASSDDIYIEDEGDITFNIAYSIYEHSELEYSGTYANTNILDSTVSEIFGNKLTLSSENTLAIQQETVASLDGTLVKVDDGSYGFLHNDEYVSFNNNFDESSSTTIALGQNGVSRIETTEAYNIGAHAIEIIFPDDDTANNNLNHDSHSADYLNPNFYSFMTSMTNSWEANHYHKLTANATNVYSMNYNDHISLSLYDNNNAEFSISNSSKINQNQLRFMTIDDISTAEYSVTTLNTTHSNHRAFYKGDDLDEASNNNDISNIIDLNNTTLFDTPANNHNEYNSLIDELMNS